MPATATKNFRFINSYSTTGPRTSKDTRRDVRSYVARVSHTNVDKTRSTRLKKDKHVGAVVFDVEITSFQDDDGEGQPPPEPALPPKKSSPPLKLPTPPFTNGGHHFTTQLDFNTYPQPQSKHVASTNFQNTMPCRTPIEERNIQYANMHPSASPIHALSAHNMTPISDIATYRLPYVPAILHNYITKLAGPLPELDDNSPRPLLRTVWLPMVMQSPAIFQVIVLFAAAHYAVYAEPSQYARFYAEVLALKQTALKGLMQGLQNLQSGRRPQTTQTQLGPMAAHKAPSSTGHGLGEHGVGMSVDSSTRSAAAAATAAEAPAVTRIVLDNTEEECLIAAIAKMASYEAIFGDAESYHTHMRAVRAVLVRRGGLASLGQDGMLSRLVRFIDTNSAFLLGTSLYLGDDEGVGVCLPRHMPFQMKRFSEMERPRSQPVSGGQAMTGDKLDDQVNQRIDIAGGSSRRIDRFVGLCGTGDAVKY